MITIHWALLWIIISVSASCGFILAAVIRGGKSADGILAKPTDDYIDWSKVPELFLWAAVDENGKAAYYSKRPYIPEDCWAWLWQDNSVWLMASDDCIIGPIPPWRESLRKRPGS